MNNNITMLLFGSKTNTMQFDMQTKFTVKINYCLLYMLLFFPLGPVLLVLIIIMIYHRVSLVPQAVRVIVASFGVTCSCALAGRTESVSHFTLP